MTTTSGWVTPEAQSTSVFLRTPPSSLSIQDRKKSKKLILPSVDCCICQESLSIHLAGEMRCELSCGDFCHSGCYSVILPGDPDMLPTCPLCRKQTKFVDESLYDKLVVEKLCHTFSPGEALSSKLYEDEYTDLEIGLQSYTPTTSPVTVKSDLERFVCVDFCRLEGDKCKLSIKSAENLARKENSKFELIAKNTAIRSEVAAYLEDLLGYVPEYGQLITFDNLYVSINGNELGPAEVFLFETAILVIQDGVEVCVVESEDFFDITKDVNGEFTIYLTSEAIPEVTFMPTSKKRVISSKWIHYIRKLISGDPIQLGTTPGITTNAWELVSHEWKSAASSPISSAPPSPGFSTVDVFGDQEDELPIEVVASANIVICVNLINTSIEVNDETYKTHLQSTLSQFIVKMRPNDKLGLVFVGIDSNLQPCKKASLMGFSDRQWEGWSIILDEIQVYSNKKLKIFDNAYEEILLGLQKCKALLSFMNVKADKVNKLIMLNSSGKLCAPREDIQLYEKQLAEDAFATNSLAEELLCSINVSIVSTCRGSLNAITRHFATPYESQCQWRKTSVTVMERAFEKINYKFLVALYQKVYVPKLNISLQIDNLEMEGTKISGIESFEITEYDIGSKFKKEFEFQTQSSEISCTIKWLDEEETKQLG